jgi:hypothetical protein
MDETKLGKRSYKQEELQERIKDIEARSAMLLESGVGHMDAIVKLYQEKQQLQRKLKAVKGAQARQQRFRARKRQDNSTVDGHDKETDWMSAASSFSGGSPVMVDKNCISPSSSFLNDIDSLSSSPMSSPAFNPPVSIAISPKTSPEEVEAVADVICGEEMRFLSYLQTLLKPNALPQDVICGLIRKRTQFVNDTHAHGNDTAKSLFKLSIFINNHQLIH